MESQISGIRLNNNISELTAIAPLKPGKAEELRTVLTALQQRPVNPVEQTQMIHYARWVIIDGGTRLLFNSNSDGSLEDYLEEFAERDEVPLNTIFGYCCGWPGAKPVGPFIQYVKDHQVRPACFYAAYPRHTVREVKRALYWKAVTELFLKDLGELCPLGAHVRRTNPRDTKGTN
ncbi:MAG TPA: hypothetical protein VJ692_09300 [Nitrospiraceae bacterium]|nr:hypothetical protein [Nitrospiraceae bacterium]